MTNTNVSVEQAYRKLFKTKRFWHVLVVLWLAYTSYTMVRRPLSVARVEIERDINVTTPELSLVDVSFTVTYAVSQLFYGLFKAHLSYYKILLFGLCGSSLSCIFLALSPNLLCLILSWALHGVSQGTAWASCLAILHSWVLPSERGRVMGWWSTNMAVGGVIGNVFPAWLIGRGYSWRTATIIEVLVGPAAMGVVTWFALLSNPNQCDLPSVQQLEHGLTVEVVRSLEKIGMTDDGEFVFASPVTPTSSQERSSEGSETAHEFNQQHEEEQQQQQQEYELHISPLPQRQQINSNSQSDMSVPSSRFTYEKEMPLNMLTVPEEEVVKNQKTKLVSKNVEHLSSTVVVIDGKENSAEMIGSSNNRESNSTSHKTCVNNTRIDLENNENDDCDDDDDDDDKRNKLHQLRHKLMSVTVDINDKSNEEQNTQNTMKTDPLLESVNSVTKGYNNEVTPTRLLSPTNNQESMPYFWTVLSFPGSLGYSVSYFINKLVRYSFMSWLPYYLSKELKTSTELAGYVASMFDIGGTIGIVVAGYCADKCYGGKRRVLVLLECTAILAVIACALGLLESVFTNHLWLCVILIFLVGAFSAALECLQSGPCLLCYCEAVHAPVAAMSSVISGIGSIGTILQGSCSIVIEYSSWSVLFTTFGIITVISGTCMIRPFFIELAELSAES